jgi:hypothetical protein
MHDSEGIFARIVLVAVVGAISAFAMIKLARRVYLKPREEMLFARRQFIGAGVFLAIALALWIVT